MQQRLYATKVQDVDELKQRTLCVSRGLDKIVLSDAINKWCKRFRTE